MEISGLFNGKKTQIDGKWDTHQVRQFNGPYEQILLEAKKQVPTKDCGYDEYCGPKILYLPDKGRLLLIATCNSFNSFDYTILSQRDQVLMLISDDMGKTWRYGYPLVDKSGTPPLVTCGVDMVYLGNGRVLMQGEIGHNEVLERGDTYAYYRFISEDWGETWTYDGENLREFKDTRFYTWASPYVDPLYSTEDEKFLIETGYCHGTLSGSYLRFSRDSGKNWSDPHLPSALSKGNEMSVVRAKNGDLVAALRYYPEGSDYATFGMDHICGMMTAYSTDNGFTWSQPEILFEYGRHQAELVSMPNGDIVMTYIVRMGYPRDEYGHIQAGLEAVVSHDFGRTWDLDHRYILDDWAGNCAPQPLEWQNAGQSASTVLLQDQSFLTVCSSGVNAAIGKHQNPLLYIGSGSELHLVHWKLNDGPVNDSREFRDSDPRSDLRNKACNYATKDGNLAAWMKHHRNIALPELGVKVIGSESDRNPDRILEDRCSRRAVFFLSCPAWFEISFPEEKCIDGLIIHPGVPIDPWQIGMSYIPIDYTIRYQTAEGQWRDVVPPVVGREVIPLNTLFVASDREITHEYIFDPIVTRKLRVDITKTSDSGRTKHLWRDILIPENRRKTVIRKVEVLEVRNEGS